MSAGADLDGPRAAPTEEPPNSLVVLLHGWGADGGDLMALGGAWAGALPRTAFASPHGPEPHPSSPLGRQWFPLGPELDLGGSAFISGAVGAAERVNAFADAELARRGVSGNAVAFVGFSQGATVALEAGMTRAAGTAAIAGYSGALAGGRVAAGLSGPRPPVLLVHGALDDVVPPELSNNAAEALTSAGSFVELHLIPGMGHGIDAEGVALGAAFLRQYLNLL